MTSRIVVGLGFGDESKGATVDWLTANYSTKAVIRFNGGPQAAHNVVTPDGRHHTFAQFGAGTFNRVPTHLSEYMMVNPFNIMKEFKHLNELGEGWALDALTIAGEALLVTPYHVTANKYREDARGTSRHGSTGHGVGETRWYAMKYPMIAPHIWDMGSPYALNRYLESLNDFYATTLPGFKIEETSAQLTEMYYELSQILHIVRRTYVNELLDSGDCVFEGAQGVLLDELYGFNPHTTWSNTTQGNARTLLAGREADTYGLIRAYMTRHGTGPFPTEGRGVDASNAPELHNGYGEYQGSWRVGHLDLSLLNYAVRANGGVDRIIVSHMDYVHEKATPFKLFRGYDGLNDYQLPLPNDRDASYRYGADMWNVNPVPWEAHMVTEDVIADGIELATNVRPTIFSYGPTRKDRVVVNDSDLASIS